jgi:two-component system heavy metal sensor histidine kinase CusS
VSPVRRDARSLVVRLVLSFAIGSAVIMASAGYGLYHALRMRMEASDLSEISGKTQVVQHTLLGVRSWDALQQRLPRIRDITVGHPRLVIGAWAGNDWLLPLPDAALAKVARAPQAVGNGHVRAEIEGHEWFLHTVRHSWLGERPGEVFITIAVDVTETRKLLQDHAIMAAVAAILGTLASTLWAWIVARRGLAPIGQLAARAGEVTAKRLGARLSLEDAPVEVHGLADSINHMLERLEESFQALEHFSADIAHELRTPLNNLLLQTQVTLGHPRTPDEYREALHSNLEELERLQRMVSDMLFLARADRGMIEPTLEQIPLRDEIDSVVEYFEPAASEKGQLIRVDGEGSVRGDRLLVRRAFTNLLSNAVRYSPTGSEINVLIDTQDDHRRISVTNDGGVSEAELRRLFARFARRDTSRGRDVEGAGLGLAIVGSIMKVLGGELEVSTRDQRVTFELRFPPAQITEP